MLGEVTPKMLPILGEIADKEFMHKLSPSCITCHNPLCENITIKLPCD